MGAVEGRNSTANLATGLCTNLFPPPAPCQQREPAPATLTTIMIPAYTLKYSCICESQERLKSADKNLSPSTAWLSQGKVLNAMVDVEVKT